MTGSRTIRSLTVAGVATGVVLVVAGPAAATSTTPTSTPLALCEPTNPTTDPPMTATASASTTVAVSVPADWFPFTSPGGDFTVSFPGEPESETQDVTLPDGSVVQLLLHSYDEGEYVFFVSNSTYAPGTPVSLDEARDGSLA